MLLENQFVVLFNPSSKLTLGCHSTSRLSLPVSGHRLFGSSFGKGWKLIGEFDFVFSFIAVASSRIVFSSALPTLTTSPLARFVWVSNSNPITVSVM